MVEITECVFCGCKEVPTMDLDLDIYSNIVKSIKVLGAKCSNCGEAYYDSKSIKVAEKIQEFLDDLA
jgi:uncharacterized OB-fold protein